MSDKRPILLTLSALFVAVAGGQLLSAFMPTDAMPTTQGNDARQKQIVAQGDATHLSGATSDGISIIDERSPDDPITDIETELKAERYSLKKQRTQLEAEKQELESFRAQIVQNSTEQHQHLATIYARMPAQKAAAVMVKLSPAEAASFIALMPGDAGADVLSAMPDDIAVLVTREMLGRTSTATMAN